MMGYANSFVATVINTNTNKSVREIQKYGRRTAPIPFGSEYKIRIKNKNSCRAMAEVFIDGTDVLFGSRIILGPGQTLDLERFVENDKEGKRFKFCSIDQAEKSGQLQDPDGPDNGHIEVKFYKETDNGYTITTTQTHGILRGLAMGSSDYAINSISPNNVYSSNTVGGTIDCMASSSKGVTVEGSDSSQQFSIGEDFDVEAIPTVIDIWLQAPQASVRKAPVNPELGWTVKYQDRYPTVFLNGDVFPGAYKVALDDGTLKLTGQGINISTCDFKVI